MKLVGGKSEEVYMKLMGGKSEEDEKLIDHAIEVIYEDKIGKITFHTGI